MRLRARIGIIALVLADTVAPGAAWAQAARPATFTMEQALGYPFPGELVSAASHPLVAWTVNLRGVRNIWAAEAPDFRARRLTDYREDDGQELTNLSVSSDGRYVVYVRGGDHGANWPAPGNLAPNPTSSPVQPEMAVWAVPTAGGAPRKLGAGDEPVISPDGGRVAFLNGRQIWIAPVDGSAPAVRWFSARGNCDSPAWSPDGRTLAFVLDREDHAFIALYTSDDQPIRYLAPSTSRDSSPRWSPDGRRLAFVRQPGRGGAPGPLLDLRPSPWAIWVADVATGAARAAWTSPETMRGSYPRTQGGANLHWTNDGQIVFLADLDGWPHLYALPVDGGGPLLLTPGSFMVEFVTMAPDRRSVVYNANTGGDPLDIDRRHLFRVALDVPKPEPLTSGTGIEWNPVVLSDGVTLAYFGATAQAPPLPMVQSIEGGLVRTLGQDQVPADFPGARFTTPESVIVQSPDGTSVHGQLFRPTPAAGAAPGSAGAPARRPAIVFVHGGPPRQMLLGWHYLFYYANAYAVNQYLASRGYVVLSVNYRLGIGYGEAFQRAERAGSRGASEYQDVLAAGRYLQGRDDVDPQRVGIWGGSYGGFLTALALGRNSDVFAAGVDIHGVHDRTFVPGPEQATAAAVGDGITSADLAAALKIAWESSPIASVGSWKSPVLLIHGDDDRNVQFHQTVDLVQRLRAARVPLEEIVIPDEIHDFLRYASWLKVDTATAAFFDKVLGRPAGPAR